MVSLRDERHACREKEKNYSNDVSKDYSLAISLAFTHPILGIIPTNDFDYKNVTKNCILEGKKNAK